MRHLRAAVAAASLLAAAAFVAATSPTSIPVALVRAASPAPSAGSGDTRSTGEAPGFVGAPLVAIVAVLILGVTAALVTIAYVRLTGGPGRGEDGASQHG